MACSDHFRGNFKGNARLEGWNVVSAVCAKETRQLISLGVCCAIQQVEQERPLQDQHHTGESFQAGPDSQLLQSLKVLFEV